MKQQHIVHIIPTLNIGGAERFVVSLCRHLSTPQVRQSVITLWDSAPLASELPEDVSYQSLHIGSIPKRKRVRTLSKLLQEMGADVVHTHLFSADLWGRLAAKHAQIPVVTTEHNINTAEPFLWRTIKRFMRRYSARYTAPSHAVAEYMSDMYHIGAADVSIIPHGIDTSAFAGAAAPRFDMPYQLLVIGRLVPQKGHAMCIEALPLLADLPLRVTIVGDGPLRASLEALARERGVEDRIDWEPAVLDVASVYAAHDVVVIPSLWEGFGLVALEAMASGRAVIASNIDGLSENIVDHETGIFAPPGDSAALAGTIRTALADTRTLATIAQAGKVYAQSHADISQMVAAYANIYMDVVSLASLPNVTEK